jgi:hypothetical protein
MLNDFDERISSPAPDFGKSPQISPDGPQLDLFGQPVAPASLSAPPAKASASKIQGICGPTSFGSSAPAGLLQSWENRLRERLAMVGSTESALIWREKVTPAGRSISRLAPWTPLTGDSGSTGSPWPTPMAGTPAQNGNNYAGNNDSIRRLEVILGLRETPNGPKAQWPTPMVADVEGGRKTRSGERSGEMLLNGLMGQWSTPRATDGSNGGPNMSFGAGGTPLPTQMAKASPWATPSARDWKDSSGMAAEQDGRNRTDQLPRQMVHFGPTPSGLPALTEKRGAPNPEFACWLMGWPEEFTSGVLLEIQSFLKSRRKS